jgi:hypothetical protein
MEFSGCTGITVAMSASVLVQVDAIPRETGQSGDAGEAVPGLSHFFSVGNLTFTLLCVLS